MSPDARDPFSFTFRRLEASDLPMLAGWLAEPRVRRWWNHDPAADAVEHDFGPSVRGDEPGDDFVVLLTESGSPHAEVPVGLLQRSVIADYPSELIEFATLLDAAGLGPVPAGAVELDYLLGDPAFRGRGIGTAMIRAAVERVWAELPGTSTVLVFVVAANRGSWRALERAGLTRIAEGPLTPDNPLDDPLHYLYRVTRPR